MSVWEFLWWLSFWVCAAVALWDFIFRPWWRERIRRALDEDFGRPKPSEEGRPPGEGWRRETDLGPGFGAWVNDSRRQAVMDMRNGETSVPRWARQWATHAVPLHIAPDTTEPVPENAAFHAGEEALVTTPVRIPFSAVVQGGRFAMVTGKGSKPKTLVICE